MTPHEARASASLYCTGGDFMKYELGFERAADAAASASLHQRTASMTCLPKFGESCTSSSA